MARPTVADIRQGLVRQLRTIGSGVPCYPTVPTNWELSPTAIAVGEFDSERVSMDGMRDYTFDLIVRSRTTDSDMGQTVIGQYMTAGGLIDTAISSDPSLGGVVDYAWFEQIGQGIGLVDNGNVQVIQGIVKVRIYA